MKKLTPCIIVMIMFSFCFFPLQLDFPLTEKAEVISYGNDKNDDDALTKTESISINYARKDKRVKVRSYTTECETVRAEKAVEFRLLEFDFDKVFTESAKRDYSGDDPFNIV